MKKHSPSHGHLVAGRSTTTRFVSSILALLLSGACVVTAADPPAPGTADPQSGPQAGPQGGNRGGNRGNFQGRGGGGGGGGTGRGGFAGGMGVLGLDDKQMDLYREASEVNRDALTKLDEKLRAAQKELLQAAIAEKYDDKNVSDKAEAVAKIQTEMTLLRAKAFSIVAPTLKPEQHDQIESSRMAAAMLTGGGMGGFGGGGAGGPGGFNGGPGGGGQGGPGGNNGGFRGRGNQGGQPGSENTGGAGGGGGGGGQRRARGGPAPTTPTQQPTQQ